MMTKSIIPLDIKCFWCDGQAKRGTCVSSTYVDHVTYFCENCGGVSHFAVGHKRNIKAIDVEYFCEVQDAVD